MRGANLNLYRTITVRDKKGKIVYQKTARSKSFVIGFLKILECHLYPSVDVTIKDTSATNNVCNEYASTFKAEWGAGQDLLGIVIGTGTTPVDNNDYVRETPIGHGVGAGELQYGATSKVTTQEVGANIDFVLQRTFVNGSGSTINVTEFGIVGMSYAVTTGKNTLMVHDVVSAVPVGNGQTLTVGYTFRTTV